MGEIDVTDAAEVIGSVVAAILLIGAALCGTDVVTAAYRWIKKSIS